MKEIKALMLEIEDSENNKKHHNYRIPDAKALNRIEQIIKFAVYDKRYNKVKMKNKNEKTK